MTKIREVRAREILDSRGNPTIEVELLLEDGSYGRAAVPSGASTGKYEAVELRDGDKKRYHGKGVLKAVGNVNGEIAKAIIGKEFDQEGLDKTLIMLDGTENKRKLGANAILGVSMAFSYANAKSQHLKPYEYFQKIARLGNKMALPLPMANILNGGRHAQNSTDLQEFMIVPIGAMNFAESVRYCAETFHSLKKILILRGLSVNVGDEGGYAPCVGSNEDALKLLVQAIEEAGFKPGKDISIALDAAASEFYENGKYILIKEKKRISGKELISIYEEWVKKYPIISIEDGFAEDDWENHALLTRKLGKKIQVVGDDLFTTNIKRLEKGIKMKAANSILIKLNQIGTVSETIDAIRLAVNSGYRTIISHRSGETEDTTIADFAVGLGADYIKTGSVCRGERTAKYNRLMKIESELKNRISLKSNPLINSNEKDNKKNAKIKKIKEKA